MSTPMTGKVHELKTWPAFLEHVISGDKTFEIRKNDRLFAVGDRLWLRGWDPREERYTDREHTLVVTYVLDSTKFGLQPGYVALGIKPFRFEDYPDEHAPDGSVVQSEGKK